MKIHRDYSRGGWSVSEIKLPADPESMRAETDREELETVRVTMVAKGLAWRLR